MKIIKVVFLAALLGFKFLSAQNVVEGPLKTRQIADELTTFEHSDCVKNWFEMKDSFLRSIMNSADKGVAAGKKEGFFQRYIDLFFLNGFPGDVLESMSEHGLFLVHEKQLPKLFEMIKRLTTKLHIAMPYVFINFDKNFFNASASSFTVNHSMLILGKDLVTKFADDEIEAVLAHECAHIHHNHVAKSLAMLPAMLISVALVIIGFERLRKSRYTDQWKGLDECSVEYREQSFRLDYEYFQKRRQLVETERKGRPNPGRMTYAIDSNLIDVGEIIAGLGVVAAFIYLMPRLSRYFEKQADKTSIKNIDSKQSFVDAMTAFDAKVRDDFEIYKKEYQVAVAKVAEYQQEFPWLSWYARFIINAHNEEMMHHYQDNLEGSGTTHPSWKTRINYGKEEVEAERHPLETQKAC